MDRPLATITLALVLLRSAGAEAQAPTPQPDTPAPPSSPEAQGDTAWYERISADLFVDGYVSANFNFPKPQGNGNGFRAYDVNNGASLHWAGLNLSYAPDPIGGTLQLRLGPSVIPYGGQDVGTGLEFVKQGYVTLKPGGEDAVFTLDFGKFDTPFGAEVADSQFNINYTRGLVYWLAQPLFHTGFRAELAPVPEFAVKLLLVNGANNSIDNNLGKSGAAQFVLKPGPAFTAYVGYMFGPEQSDSEPEEDDSANERFRHLVDVVADLTPVSELRLLGNFDFGAEQLPTDEHAIWIGGSLAAKFTLTEVVALGIRGEVLYDELGFVTATGEETLLGSGTLTANLTPWKYFSSYVDVRVDGSSNDDFKQSFEDVTNYQVSTTLGIIAKSQ